MAEFADAREGVVSRAELRQGLGMSSSQIDSWVRRGVLRVLYPGVYAFGHRALTLAGWLRAAVLAGGEGAALGDQSGAAWLCLRQGFPSKPHVVAPRSRKSGRGLIKIHRPRLLLPQDLVLHRSIPTTSPSRTLLDCAATDSTRRLRAKIGQAERHRLLDVAAIEDVVSRNSGHRGAARLMRQITAFRPDPDLREKLEQRFHALMSAATDLPPYKPNHPFGPYLLDAYFERHRLAVELDGYATHGNMAAFIDDRARDRYLTLHGITSLRFTWWDVDEAPSTIRSWLRGRDPAAA